jgi:hypothetical protein
MKNQYKFSLIFPLPSSKDWKNGLTKKEINKIIRNNNQPLKMNHNEKYRISL